MFEIFICWVANEDIEIECEPELADPVVPETSTFEVSLELASDDNTSLKSSSALSFAIKSSTLNFKTA